MLISFEHNFIFVHCRKAAGTSVDAYFARALGADDLMIGSWCAARRNGAKFNQRFKKEILSVRGIKCIGETIPERIARRRFGVCSLINESYKNFYKGEFSTDPTFPKANELMKYVGQDFWNRAYKFTIIRNTFERTVSDWIWRKKVKNAYQVTFNEFLQRLNDPGRPDPEGIVPTPYNNFELYTLNGESVVDFIGTVDQLKNDMKKICYRIGLEFNPKLLPHEKKSTQKLIYKNVYGSSELKLINKIYGEEIEYHKFKF